MRVYIADFSEECVIMGDDYHYLVNVMRVKVGFRIIIFNQNLECEYEVNEIKKREIRLKFLSKIRTNEGRLKVINLYQSIVKGDRMCDVVNNAVQLSVSRIIPVISHNCHIRDVNLDRLSSVAKTALEQSYGMLSAIIERPIKFENVITSGINIYGDLNASNGIKNIKHNNEEINIFIGPEGGFSDAEIEYLSKMQNSFGIKIGNRVMRAENAVTSLMTMAHLL